jgi:hypothetical protein
VQGGPLDHCVPQVRHAEIVLGVLDLIIGQLQGGLIIQFHLHSNIFKLNTHVGRYHHVRDLASHAQTLQPRPHKDPRLPALPLPAPPPPLILPALHPPPARPTKQNNHQCEGNPGLPQNGFGEVLGIAGGGAE